MRLRGMLMAAVFSLPVASPTPGKAQMAEGTKGWCTFTGCYGTAIEACKAQHAASAPSQPFYGYTDTGYWFAKHCEWKTGLGVIYPASVYFNCEGNYRMMPGERCVKTDEDFPNHANQNGSNCPVQSINNGGSVTAATSNPIDLFTGAKLLRIDDFRTADGSLSLSRVYNHLPFGSMKLMRTVPLGLARNWQFDFQTELHLYEYFSYSQEVELATADGMVFRFKKDAAGDLKPEWQAWTFPQTDYTLAFVGTWPASSEVLTRSTQWEMRDPERRTWLLQTFPDPVTNQYSVARPVRLTFENGLEWNFAYGSNRQLLSVTDSFGKSLTFTWIMNGPPPGSTLPAIPAAISEVALPDGATLRYVYETLASEIAPTQRPDRLIKVEHRDTGNAVIASTTYHYEDARHPAAVTGISDTHGVRRWTVTYDARGRALTSEGPGGADRISVSYGTLASSILPRTVTNALGKDTRYRIERFGSQDYRLRSVDGAASAHCPASSLTFAYGSNQFLSSVTDEEGRVTSFSREARGLPTAVTRGAGTPSAVTTGYSWHPSLRVPTQIVEPGRTTELSWNAAGQLTQLTQTDTTSQSVPYSTNGQTRTWTYTYGAGGVLTSVDGPLGGAGDTVTYAYNAQGYLQSVTNEVGHVTQFTSWNGRGQATTMVDPNGETTNFLYDPLGRLTSMTADPGGINATTSFEYDAVDQITRITRPNGAYLQFTWNDARRLTRIEDNTGASIDYDRDAMGNITARRVKDAGGTVLLSQTATFDELGRLLTFVGAQGQTWTYGYDKTDNQVAVTDPRANVYRHAFDALNRLMRETDEDSAAVDLTRDGQDEVTAYRDPRALTTTYVRNGFGDVIQRTSPDSGTTVYQLNALGQPTQITDGRGVVSDLAYDNAGRLLGKTYPAAPEETVSYTYDATSGGNKGIGRLTRIDDQSGAVAWVYDALGRKTQEIKTTGAAVYTVGYAYDADGNITAMTYPSGRSVTFARDALGRISGVTTKKDAGSASVTLAADVAYRPFGPLQSLTYGNGLALQKSFTADYLLDLLRVEDGAVPQDIISRTHARADGLNLTGIADNVDPGRSESYTYSATNRLQGAAGPWGTLAWQYDGVGNRTSEILTAGGGSVASVLGYPADSNRVASVAQGGATVRSFSHDGAGNVIADDRAGTVYAYRHNRRGRLDRVSVGGAVRADYVYDGLERLARRSTQGMSPAEMHYVHDLAGRLIAEADASGAPLRDYIWLDDMPLAVAADLDTASPQLYFVHADHLDRPIRMTDAGKAVVWDAAYRPFGEVQAIGGAATLNLRFPGQYFLLEAGLHYNWHRHYDPTLGRYLQPDPLGFVDGPSVYGYANANPTKNFDRRGQQSSHSRHHPGLGRAPFPFPGTPEWTDQFCKGMTGLADWLQNLVSEARKSEKEKASNTPSWARGEKPFPGESGKEFADRLMDKRYGKGSWKDTGPKSEHSKIKKYGDRSKK